MKLRVKQGTGKYVKFLFEEEKKAEDMAVSRTPVADVVAHSMEEVKSLMSRYFRRDIPFLLMGASGFAKSALIKEVGTSIPGFQVPSANIKDIRVGMSLVEDLKGLPTLLDKLEDDPNVYTRDSVPAWLEDIIRKPKENFILFFDEINHATVQVLNSLYGIILERRVGDYSFLGRTRIAAAANKADQNLDVSDLSEPLKNRMQIIDVDVAVDTDPEYFHEYLNDKYSREIPQKILDILWSRENTLSNPRAVDQLLRAWVEDIQDGERILTRTGAIPPGVQAEIQKIYEKEIYKTSGSQAHKDIIKKLQERISSLIDEFKKNENSEMFKPIKTYNISDINSAKTNSDLVAASQMSSDNLSTEGVKQIVELLSKEGFDKEMIEAALV